MDSRRSSSSRIAAVAICAALLGLATPAGASPAPAPHTRACTYYGITIALGLLTTAKRQPNFAIPKQLAAWKRLLREAHDEARFPPIQSPEFEADFQEMLTTLHVVDATLRDGNLVSYRRSLNLLGPQLAALDALAKRAHLRCTIHSGKSTITFGG